MTVVGQVRSTLHTPVLIKDENKMSTLLTRSKTLKGFQDVVRLIRFKFGSFKLRF